MRLGDESVRKNIAGMLYCTRGTSADKDHYLEAKHGADGFNVLICHW